jgi:thymidylate synthase
MNFSAETLDELLRIVLTHFLHRQDLTPINPRKGSAKEEFGVLLELKNPRARLSRTEIKGTPFSCLGELSWYLSGSNSLAHMQYYIDRYDEFSDDGETIHGAYGPRLKNMHGEFNQIENIIQFLRDHSDSRRAVIQIYDASDLVHDGKDVPLFSSLRETADLVC